MFELKVGRMSFDKGLQIIQADVRLSIDGELLIEEPLCLDVGLPALLLSGLESTEPNRFASAREWKRMPFFVCGCGDPECRAHSFRVNHLGNGTAEWTLLEESQDGTSREQESFVVAAAQCREQLLELGERFLAYTSELDYRPYFPDTLPVVRELVERLKSAEDCRKMEAWAEHTPE
ncbi:hypothetical protein [Paenibacillus oceani]|nr:hypothetical protein [Paenibacillus oceani]